METPIVEVCGVSKSFPGVQALQSVQLKVFPGEIHALVGENGSGKSTLMKIIAGVYRPDGGELLLDGRPVESWGPAASQRAGISAIYQELSLFPDLSVAENCFIGHDQFVKSGLVRWEHIRKRTADLLGYLTAGGMDPRVRADSLSVAQRQIVEIAKALAATRVRVLLMDEPTSALSLEEVENLFVVMRRLRADGVGIVFISHKIEEVLAIAGRVTVLRDGAFIASQPSGEVDHDSLIRMMIGRDIKQVLKQQRPPKEEKLLEVENLTRRGIFEGISFHVSRGEILGIFGLVGSRRTEVAQAIFGVAPAESGVIRIEGNPVRVPTTSRALGLGIGLIPEDRGIEGLILEMSIAENLTLPILERLFPWRFIGRDRENETAQAICAELQLKHGGVRDGVDSLSGGNKQKVVLAKWLLRKARILIFDEPTKGIDVGAKDIIHSIMGDLARTGVGIIMISSELPEILKLSDRILVMAKGVVTGRFDAAEATQDKIMRHASSSVR
jgi:rhamnose transport system ATP-binding protein